MEWKVMTGPILESNTMHMIFQKKGKKKKKGKKRAKYLKIWAKLYKILKYFEEKTASYMQLSHAWNS